MSSAQETERLLPHQSAFVDSVLDPDTKPLVVLRADVGLGKGYAMAALVARVLREHSGARVLVLCPGALREQWGARLRLDNTHVMVVDRYRFRELLEAAVEGDPWPRGTAVILSDAFARQADVRSALAGENWDLVVADEAHRFVGLRATLLSELIPVAKRVVLATATASPELDRWGAVGEATVLEWHRGEIERESRSTVPRPAVRTVAFTPAASERRVLECVRDLCVALVKEGRAGHGLVARQLLRSSSSSPAALEGMLRGIEARSGMRAEALFEDETGTAPELIEPIADQVRAAARAALEELEGVHEHSKSAVLVTLLRTVTSEGAQRICVVTSYLRTLYYLAAELEDCGLSSVSLHGSMASDERALVLGEFRQNGGILVATPASLEGSNLADTEALVLYDIPWSPTELHQTIGRFDRFGRTTQLFVHALVQADGPAAQVWDRLQTFVAGGTAWDDDAELQRQLKP